MPETTAGILRTAAHLITRHGLHTGDQFATRTGRLDISAAIYTAAEGTTPAEFHTDEAASIRLIECSARAMQAIRAVSDALDTPPCVTTIAPGHDVPDHLEHVSNWAATPPVLTAQPPTTSEVIDRLLRTADTLDSRPHLARRAA